MESKVVIVNKSTGSEFEIIAHDSTNNLRAGVRFWIATKGNAKCGIGFRIRVVSEEGAPAPSNFESFCKTTYPKAKWTGGSSIHGSIAGLVQTNYMQWQWEEILAALKEADTGGSLYDALSAVFTTMRIIFTRELFEEYFLHEVEAMLKGDPKNTSKAVVIDFMGYSKKSEPPVDVAITLAEPKVAATAHPELEEQTL